MVKIKTPLNLLSYLITVLAVIPLFGHLDIAVRAVFLMALICGILFDRRDYYPVKNPLATAGAIASFLFYGSQISIANLIAPIINMLTLLLALRLLSEKSARHYLQIFVLAIFALASSSLLSLSIAFFVYLIMLVTSVTVGLVLLTFYSTDKELALNLVDLRKTLGVALVLPVISLFLMVVFFFILPRTQRPLWQFLNPAPAAKTGFSEEVRPGGFASSAAVKTAVFRADCQPLPQDELYWRGIVLDTPVGNRWIRGRSRPQENARLAGGRTVDQTIYPEPNRRKFLFALDIPRRLEGIRAAKSPDQIFTVAEGITKRSSYKALSLVGGALEVVGPDAGRHYLQTPPQLSPRLLAEAERIRSQESSAEGRIALLRQFFLDQALSYATTDLPTGENSISAFLFEKKRGYCEYFASSFAILLRLCGVPARLVGGYLGGNYNELGGYYTVTEDMAHVWVEALVGRKWLRIDPSRLAQNAQTALLDVRLKKPALLRRVADAVNYHWNQMVIAYDLREQLQLLRRTNRSLRQVSFSLPPKRILAWAAIIVLIAAAGWKISRWKTLSVEERLIRRFFVQIEKKYGLCPLPATGLAELAAAVDDPLCREFAKIYSSALYQDRKLSAREIARLKEILDNFR